MTDELVDVAPVDRGQVRLTKTSKGVSWSVTVGVGTTEAELEAARVIAEKMAGRLERDTQTPAADAGGPS